MDFKHDEMFISKHIVVIYVHVRQLRKTKQVSLRVYLFKEYPPSGT